ncbi:MAG: hypothetical protein IID42_08640, partial [Planctomycetes bacterium]|nr:hypothetical protein [Planctomycetota bacterium]
MTFQITEGAAPRELFADSLGWMRDARVANRILPFIERKVDGRSNPRIIQESAIIALCVLAPEDLEIYNRIQSRYEDQHGHSSNQFGGLLADRVHPYLERYAEKNVALREKEQDASTRSFQD